MSVGREGQAKEKEEEKRKMKRKMERREERWRRARRVWRMEVKAARMVQVQE